MNRRDFVAVLVVISQSRTKYSKYIQIPGAVHYTLMRSPTKSSTLHCGMQVEVLSRLSIDELMFLPS